VSTKNGPSLRTPSLASVTWYVSVLGGWALFGTAIHAVFTASLTRAGGPLLMTASLLLLLELLPLVQGRGHDPQGVVMSTAFVCAMLFMWGLWPAVVMVSVAAVSADMRARKPWWKVIFNAGQYNLSVAAGWLCMLPFHNPTLEHPLANFGTQDMGWVILVWIAYFSVNLALVAGVLSYNASFVHLLFEDFVHYAMMSFAVLALSPLVVVLSENLWPLLPLLLIPLLLLYWTAQMSLEKEHEASHDALTGLPNRTTLHFSLRDGLERYTRERESFGLMLIDLDDFKRVNDTLGHPAGDDLLVQIAARLRASVRPTDVVARLGGDEFAVILPGASEADVHAVAQRIRASLLAPIELEGVSLEVEASVGIALCPEHGVDADVLLQRADVAMYVAKESREGVLTYSADRDRNTADRLTLLGELRQALDDDVLELHYQPKVGACDSVPMGVEALVRWNHPQRGYVPPDEFIPLAERSGMMHLLTARVISIALDQATAWLGQGLHVPVAVNISPTDLVGSRLSAVIAAGLREHDLPPGMLQLEITERIVAEETEEVTEVLRELRSMGVSISLDDFGTGYSSLLRLQTLPVDELKIDRAFVTRLADGAEAAGIVRAVIDVAHALGMTAIAEGVETQEEWDLLVEMGCDGVQGWHVAMPMPTELATAWLRSRLSGAAPVRQIAGAAAGAHPRR
jgi:diguanylate cyclase (GGDEF)-like protein